MTPLFNLPLQCKKKILEKFWEIRKWFYIFVKNKLDMVNKVFMVLGVVLLIGGNILSYVYNGRMLYPMTNICFVMMIVLNFYNYKIKK
jgi:hypothetical protein